jgi:hypothetical protein
LGPRKGGAHVLGWYWKYDAAGHHTSSDSTMPSAPTLPNRLTKLAIGTVVVIAAGAYVASSQPGASASPR